MRRLLILIVLIGHAVCAQKRPLDYSMCENWPGVGTPKLSNDGRFLIVGASGAEQRLIIKATDNSWSREVLNAFNEVITEDSRTAIFFKPGDSLCLLDLAKDQIVSIAHVASYKVPKEGEGKWMAYQLIGPEKDLVLRNLLTEEEKKFRLVDDYSFSNNGTVLLLKTVSGSDSVDTNSLIWVNLKESKSKIIWIGSQPGNFSFDDPAHQLTFISAKTREEETVYSIWFFQNTMDSAVLLVDGRAPGVDQAFAVSNEMPVFSKDGKRVFFSLREDSFFKDSVSSDSRGANVDIWSYKDDFLQSQQQDELKWPGSLRATLKISEGKVVRLQKPDEVLIGNANTGNSDFIIVRTKMNPPEMNWKLAASPSIYLVSTKDGSRKLIKEHLVGYQGYGDEVTLSPNGKYVIYYESEQKSYFAYNTITGQTKNITKNIPVPLFNVDDDRPQLPPSYGLAAWSQEGNAVFIYDQYDIWQVDPEGLKTPLNVTGGYGRAHSIVFRLMNFERGRSALPFLRKGDMCMLTAFNLVNKDNGFYKFRLKENEQPVSLTMGPYIYFLPYNAISISAFINISSWHPVKAKNKEIYLVNRMNASEAPNIYATSDFIDFTQLTDIHPERECNWMTATLVHWTMFDGRKAEGVLYKPENFDPKRKYAVIFYFYERPSDGLNRFIQPEPTHGPLNIPFFVSNGYVVFVPNIYYKVGEPGESAYNAVTSAATWLSQHPWVDTARMGLQGHSFGAYEVNYLVTKTSMFAAACSAAGASDFINNYGSISLRGGYSQQGLYELGQSRIGASLWQRPDLYIKNSPVFGADKINTPILLMHNKADAAVPWIQGIEFFTALRRLGKRAWLLQYSGGNHSLFLPEDIKDFSTRLMQFFDHYLKGIPAPVWMTESIPARLKGMKMGLELDSSGRYP